MVIYLIYCLYIYIVTTSAIDTFDEIPSNVVKLGVDLLPFDDMDPPDSLSWFDGLTTNVYCRAHPSLHNVQLRFECPTCPTLGHNNEWLKKSTKDFSSKLRQPVIKLAGKIEDSKNWLNHQLACHLTYDVEVDGSIVMKDASTSVSLLINYLDQPVVVERSDDGDDLWPLVDATGTMRLYVPPKQEHGIGQTSNDVDNGVNNNVRSSLKATLKCMADSNPQIEHYGWWDGARPLNNTSQFLSLESFDDETAMQGRRNGKIVRCKSSIGSQSKESENVLIESAVVPFMLGNNFQKIRETYQPYVVGKTNVQLQCTYGSWPTADIVWYFEDSTGKISNLNCDRNQAEENRQNSIVNQNYEYNMINRTCSIDLINFNQSGNYWCNACIQIAKDKKICDSEFNVVPPHLIYLNVSGLPVRSQHPTRIDRNLDHGFITIHEPFCSNPPAFVHDVYLTCNDQRINMFENLENVHLQHMIPISSTPNMCYEVSVVVKSIETIDKSYFCTLTISNKIGTLQYSIPIGTFVATNRTDFPSSESMLVEESSSSMSIIWISVVVVFCTICIIFGILYCWNHRRSCFAYRKADTNSEDFNKSDSKDDDRGGDGGCDSDRAGSCLTIGKNCDPKTDMMANGGGHGHGHGFLKNGGATQEVRSLENGTSNHNATSNVSHSPVTTTKNGYHFVSNEVVV